MVFEYQVTFDDDLKGSVPLVKLLHTLKSLSKQNTFQGNPHEYFMIVYCQFFFNHCDTRSKMQILQKLSLSFPSNTYFYSLDVCTEKRFFLTYTFLLLSRLTQQNSVIYLIETCRDTCK